MGAGAADLKKAGALQAQLQSLSSAVGKLLKDLKLPELIERGE